MGRHTTVTSKPGRMVTQPATDFLISGSNAAGWTVVGSAGAADMYIRPGFEPPAKKSAARCITVQPLLVLQTLCFPTAYGRVCH